MAGWIKLHRKLLENPVFDKPELLKVWLWCLLKATHDDHEQMIGLEIVKLKPGQFITGRFKGAGELNINPSTFYKYLKMLEKLQMISLNCNNKMTVVTVENWGKYQTAEEETYQQNNNEITTKEQQNNTNKNDKNNKNTITTTITTKEPELEKSVAREDADSSKQIDAVISEITDLHFKLTGSLFKTKDFPELIQILNTKFMSDDAEIEIGLETRKKIIMSAMKRIAENYTGSGIKTFRYFYSGIMDEFQLYIEKQSPKEKIINISKDRGNHGGDNRSGTSSKSDGAEKPMWNGYDLSKFYA